MPSLGGAGRRVAIVAGVRTPFARAGTVLKHMSAIELGKLAVAELLQRTDLDPSLVLSILNGSFVQSEVSPTIAR
jgi:acetyl-CoA acyltransferase